MSFAIGVGRSRNDLKGGLRLPTSGSQDQTPEPRIEERAVQPYLKIRRQVTSGVPDAVDDAFPALFAWLGERGIEPAGPPFIRTLEVDEHGEPLELEVSVPVAEAVSGGREVEADTLPAGRYLTVVHVGPYRSETETDLADARAALLRFARERGIVYSLETARGATLPCAVEHFRIGPVDTPDYSTWETEFAYLIVD
jgi:effector-binding domain-containing protein